MKWMRNTVIAGLMAISMAFWANVVLAQMEHGMSHGTSAGESKVADGIKATFKVAPSMGMVDILLEDADTGKPITKAKVAASIKGPDGKVQEKELIGMKMGKEYTFGNTVDFSLKGKYSFDITTEVEKKKVKFNFGYEVE